MTGIPNNAHGQGPSDLNSPAQRLKRAKARSAERRRAFEPIRQRLLEVGVECESVSELIESYSPLHSDIVSVLLESIPDTEHETVLDMLLRALIMAQDEFDCEPLVGLFQNTRSPNLQFSAANTLLSVPTTGVSKEILAEARRVVYKK